MTTTGNSRAISLEAALFAAHPEFGAKGRVAATVIAPGRLLLSVEASEEAADDDPVFEAFLAFVGEDMRRHPERLHRVTAEDAARAETLTTGVEVSDDDIMPDDFTI